MASFDTVRTPPWVAPFYDRKSEAVGPSGVLDHHRERAQAINTLTGRISGRVLELGAGAGGTAVATALMGYDVTAVELSTVRAAYAEDLKRASAADTLEVICGDFLDVPLATRFDVVVMWNGFGVGDDEYQRRVLQTSAAEWLAEDGCFVLDVFNPVAWARWAGSSEVDPETGLRQEVEFDVDGSRFIDRWYFDGPEAAPLEQSVRCYSPADLRLLVEGSGLFVERIVHQVSAPVEAVATASGPHGEAWGYRAVLRRSNR